MMSAIPDSTISRVGMRTVVSEGTLTRATGMSSKPVTERSAGTRRPRFWAACSGPDRDDVRRRDERGRRLRQLDEPLEDVDSALEVVARVLQVFGTERLADAVEEGGVRLLALADVAQAAPPGERDAAMAEPREVLEDGVHAVPVVDVDRRDAGRTRSVPERDDGHPRVLEVLDERRPVAQVAEQHDRIAVARLEDAPQRDRLVGAAVGMAEHDVVVAPAGLDGCGLDRAAKKGSVMSRTMTPSSIVRAPRRPRASGLGR